MSDSSTPVDTPMTNTTTDTPACQHCGRVESELGHSLKSCAKCKTAKYCSRDCQKYDYKSHKRACRTTAATNSANANASASGAPPRPSSKRPSHEQMLKEATAATDLLVALVSSPEHRNASPAQPEPPILKHLIGFIIKTLAVYWTPLLPRRKALELSARARQDDPVGYMEAGTARMAELAEKGIHVDTWPDFDPELYSDAVGRGWMATLIVTDDSKQPFFGMPPGTVYNWSEAVREEVRKQRSEAEGST